MPALLLACLLNSDPYRETLRLKSHGDKESLWFALEALRIPFQVSSTNGGAIGNTQEDPNSNKILCGPVLQFDHSSKPLWFSGNSLVPRSSNGQIKQNIIEPTQWATEKSGIDVKWDTSIDPSCLVTSWKGGMLKKNDVIVGNLTQGEIEAVHQISDAIAQTHGVGLIVGDASQTNQEPHDRLAHSVQQQQLLYQKPPVEPIPNFHTGKPGDEYTHTDRLAPITSKKITELHYGDLPRPHGANLTSLTHEIIPCLQNGTTIFVDSTHVPKFFDEMFPKITTTFVLISGDSDLSVPNNLRQDVLESALASPLMLHWFAMNCDRNPDPKRFTCLMNGVSQWGDALEKMQQAVNLGYHQLPKTDDYQTL
eukprot:jgi/Hompol1/2082/HPOL_005837-RA